MGFQPNDPGDHPFDGPGIQIPAAAPKNVLAPRRSGFRSLCREEQLLLRFFGDGSRHLKLEQA